MSKKKKILRIILIIILVILILVVIHTVRNLIIVKKLQKNVSQYSSSTNFHIKITGELETDYYEKDGKEKVIMTREDDAGTTVMTMYKIDGKTDIFWDTPTGKKVSLDTDELISVSIWNGLETENNWQLFLSCLTSSIKKITFNEKECYMVKGFMSCNVMNGEETYSYIEEDTGLLMKYVMDEIETVREYEFNTVVDEMFIEPDISEYEINE